MTSESYRCLNITMNRFILLNAFQGSINVSNKVKNVFTTATAPRKGGVALNHLKKPEWLKFWWTQ